MIIYRTTVQEVGPSASDFFSERMVVLFGGEAPSELKPFCFIIDKNKLNGQIEVGDFLVLDGQSYKVENVGNQVNRNLEELGHITINFQDNADQDMAGTLYVESKELTVLKAGSIIEIKRQD